MVFRSELREFKKEVKDFVFDTESKKCLILVDKLEDKLLSRIKTKHPEWKCKQIEYSDLISNAPKYFDYVSTDKNQKIYEIMNLKKKTIITYSLENLDRSKKTLFGYALKGRGSDKGILQKSHGQTLGRNSLILPFENKLQIIELMHYWKINFCEKEVYEI